MTTITTITRRYAHPGMTVRVNLRNHRDEYVSGTLTGWGQKIIEIAPDERTRAKGYTWKRHSFPNVHVSSVETLDDR